MTQMLSLVLIVGGGLLAVVTVAQGLTLVRTVLLVMQLACVGWGAVTLFAPHWIMRIPFAAIITTPPSAYTWIMPSTYRSLHEADHTPHRFDNYYFTARLTRQAYNNSIEVTGLVHAGIVTKIEARGAEEDTDQAPVHMPGNRHFTLHPVKITRAEFQRAMGDILRQWREHNTNDFQAWMDGHVEHGEVGWGNGTGGYHLACGCGKDFWLGSEHYEDVPDGFAEAHSRSATVHPEHYPDPEIRTRIVNFRRALNAYKQAMLDGRKDEVPDPWYGQYPKKAHIPFGGDGQPLVDPTHEQLQAELERRGLWNPVVVHDSCG